MTLLEVVWKVSFVWQSAMWTKWKWNNVAISPQSIQIPRAIMSENNLKTRVLYLGYQILNMAVMENESASVCSYISARQQTYFAVPCCCVENDLHLALPKLRWWLTTAWWKKGQLLTDFFIKTAWEQCGCTLNTNNIYTSFVFLTKSLLEEFLLPQISGTCDTKQHWQAPQNNIKSTGEIFTLSSMDLSKLCYP